MSVMDSRVRRRFEVSGAVQGVGFRPFVYVTASQLALSGSVFNDSSGVVIEVEGDEVSVGEFETKLRTAPPPLAVVDGVRTRDLAVQGGTGFVIGSTVADGKNRTLASPDVAMCQDCDGELRDRTNRRYRHPFITCTNCGPRFTIMTGLPYDRASTTMGGFTMCAACRTEYEDPVDRRFHAQTIACTDCGPRLRFVDKMGAQHRDEAALTAARASIAGGSIVAIKGIGGYHLACDASNEHATGELRRRKQRGDKPFAVMVADLATAHELTTFGTAAERLLAGNRRPIVLLARRTASDRRIASSVAPGNPDLGLLLPYTPLHALLFGIDTQTSFPSALVMTSGNLAGEPIAFNDANAMSQLSMLADAWLSHDRAISVPCDDSVTRVVAGAELPIRRSRGYAPLPIVLPFEVEATLAVGADVKNTCAVASGRYAWLSQHIGDMDNVETIDALTASVQHLEQLTGVDACQLVTDMHPAYRSSNWAVRHAQGRPIRTVQHHHAHIAAVMGEHRIEPDQSVIGFAFDGSGYGTDGAVWGGEVLIANYKGFRRAAQLQYVSLAGGDASVRRTYRMALSHLHNAGIGWEADIPSVAACPARERAVLAHQLKTGLGCVQTSSMGRLFDAVASLAGVRHEVTYEAEAAIEFEGLARGVGADQSYEFGVGQGNTIDETTIVSPTPVIRSIVADVRAGVSAATIAARFHAAVCAMIMTLADLARQQTALDTVVLAGGVFHNALILETSLTSLTQGGFTVLRPQQLPANDGGIALGQILLGASG